MSSTNHFNLKLTGTNETSMTFLEWRTLMNGVDCDSNMEVIDAALHTLQTSAQAKADGFSFDEQTGVLQLTTGGKPIDGASVLIDLGEFYTRDEVDSMVSDAKSEAGVNTVEWDESSRTLTLYNGNGDMIGEPVVIEGGGASATYNYTVSLVNHLESRALTVTADDDVELKFIYTSVDENGADDGAGVCAITVNNIKVATLNVPQGENSLNVAKYLTAGENTVKLRVENSENSAKTLIYTVSVVTLTVSTSFSTMGTYSGDVLFSYTPTGSGEKTVHFLMDGVEIGTQVVTSSSRSKDYLIPAQEHGGHILTLYATANVGDVDVRSNTLTLGMIWVDETSMEPAITSTFVRTEATQGEALTISYMVYDPMSESPDVILSVVASDGSIYSTKTIQVDRTAHSWAVSDYPIGKIKFRIACGSAVIDLPVTVTESSVEINPIRDGLVLEFNAIGRNNGEANPAVWNYGGDIQATFDGFGWVSDGWYDDEDGVTCLRFLPGDKMVIPYKLFDSYIQKSGVTIEVDMATHNVRDYDSVVFTNMSNGRGFKIASQYAQMSSEQSSVTMQFKEDSRVRIAIVIENENLHRLVYIYINGVMCGVTQYATTDNFQQNPAESLVIGAESCGIDLYRIRFYNKGLTRAEELDNFIYDQPTLSDRLDAYNRNDVLDENDEIVISKLPPDLAYMIISCPELPQSKGDKKQGVEITYVNPAETARSFTADGVQIDVQGTSSQGYKKKNFKYVLKNGLTYTASGEYADKYQLYAGAIPVDTFCLKADVASSENANNVMLVDLYNSLCPYKTPPQQVDNRVRQGIYGSPCVVFWHNTTTNETRFWGKYNFNNDKSTADAFGLTDGCESWEFCNNTSDRSVFKSADFYGTGWQNDFEARYPEDSTDISRLKAVCEWVVSTDREAATGNALTSSVTYDGVIYKTDTAAYRLAKFKAEFEQHFIKEAMLFYYLFTEIFLMVDSRAKNLFLSTYDGTHWMPLPYDFDTALGINNEGQLVFDYDLEDTDLVDNANVFNGQDSVLWNNVRDAFGDDIKTMYKTLRSAGTLSYSMTKEKFENHQSTWPEAIWNEDAYEKYLEPLMNDNDGSYLKMLQGDKSSQRDWWLFNGFRYRDSKYHTGDALTNYIMLRAYTDQTDTDAVYDITVTPYSTICPMVKYGSYEVTREDGLRVKRNTSATLKCPMTYMNDTEVYIYSADRIADVGDLSGLRVGYADFSRAVKLQQLLLGSDREGYENPNLDELHVGNNELLMLLDIQNCTSLTETVDLSGCASIETIKASGSAITGVTLPNGGRLKTIELPETITNFTIRNQKALGSATFGGYEKLSTLYIEDTPNLPIEELINNATSLDRVRLVNVDWAATSAETLAMTVAKLKACGGMEANGQNTASAYVSGRVRVASIGSELLEEINDQFPNLVVVVNGVPNYLVRYLNYDGTLLYNAVVGEGDTAPDPVALKFIEAPTKPGSETSGYIFKDWGSLPADIHGNCTVIAQYGYTYLVKYVNYDNSVLYSVFVAEGSSASDPVAAGLISAPTRPSDETVGYVYSGWDSLPTNVIEPCTVIAQYGYTYLVKYVNYDGTVLQTTWVASGGSVSYTGSTPTKASTAQYTYTFSGWSTGGTTGTVSNVTSTKTITAQFSSTLRTYTVKFYNGTTLLQTVSNVAYGSTATYTGETPVSADGTADEGYEFTGWLPSNTNITGDTNCYAQYTSPVEVVEITDDWETVRKNVAAGTYLDTYKVGNYKSLDLGDEGTVTMQIVAMNADEMEDGNNAPITWVARELLKTSHQMNPAYSSGTEGTGTIGGWEKSEMRTYLNDTIKPLIPDETRKQIKAVKKESRGYDTSGAAFQNSTVDEIWIPSYREVFKSSDLETTGPMYSAVYSDSASRIKMKADATSTTFWWLRSAYSATVFRCVISGGDWYSGIADSSYGVALGFSTGADTITDSWEEILQSIEDGTYKEKYSIGDTKQIDLGAQGKVCAQIAAFDADELSDGSGTAAITWVCEELCVSAHRMNASLSGNSTDGYTEGTGTIGGWEKSEMRTYLNDTIKPLIPDVIRNAIKTVNKTSASYNTSGGTEVITTQDDVWIPSYREVTNSTSYEKTGPVYTSLFSGNNARIKRKYGSSSADWWWLRSATGANGFYDVDYDGIMSSSGAYNSNGVALSFCT